MWLSYRRECICNRCLQQAADPTVCPPSPGSQRLLSFVLMLQQPSPCRPWNLQKHLKERPHKHIHICVGLIKTLPDVWGVCLVKLHSVYKRIQRSKMTMLLSVWGLEKCNFHCTNILYLLQTAKSSYSPYAFGNNASYFLGKFPFGRSSDRFQFLC